MVIIFIKNEIYSEIIYANLDSKNCIKNVIIAMIKFLKLLPEYLSQQYFNKRINLCIKKDKSLLFKKFSCLLFEEVCHLYSVGLPRCV